MVSRTGFRFPDPLDGIDDITKDYLNELVRSLQYFDEEIFSQDGGYVFEAARVHPVVSVISDYTVGQFDSVILVDASSGDITITFPDPFLVNKKFFDVKRTDTNGAFSVSVESVGAEFPVVLSGTSRPSTRIYSNGETYWVM